MIPLAILLLCAAIRLLAIDAPEMAGHCRKGRACAPGDPIVCKQSLAAALHRESLAIDRVGQDLYGRTLAVVTDGGVNLSCWQLRAGQAVYVGKWDNELRIQKDCSVMPG